MIASQRGGDGSQAISAAIETAHALPNVTVRRRSTGVLDAGSTRPGSWLRSHRLRFALSIAVVEGILVVAHVLPKWPVFLLAVIAIGAWWYAGRQSRSDLARQASWVAAASQALVLLVPVVLFVATTIAIVVLALLAIAALIFLFTERS